MNEFVLHVNNYNKNELYIKNKHARKSNEIVDNK